MQVRGTEKNYAETSKWWRKSATAEDSKEKREKIIKHSITLDAKGSINGNKVNVRTAPYTSSKIVKQLNSGHPINITKRNSDWYFVSTASGTEGWVFGDFVIVKDQNQEKKTAKISYQVPPLSQPANLRIELTDADGKRNVFNGQVDGQLNVTFNASYKQEAIVSVFINEEMVSQQQYH